MEEKVVSTSCPMDCPDTCALEVTVENGCIRRIRDSEAHPNTGGFICAKVAQFARRVYHADRLPHPMRRIGAKGAAEFVRISWAEATSRIAEAFRAIRREWGGEAILPYHYGGSNGFLGDEFLDDSFFARLGASRLAKTICAAPSTAVAEGMYGKMPGVAFEDFVHAKCIIIWGANPKGCSVHLLPYLREAKRRGAFIAAIDPARNFSAREIDLHLGVYPGTDLCLALAMIRLWMQQGRIDEPFLQQHAREAEPLLGAADAWPLERAAEVSRVPAGDIRALAQVYATASPALIRAGWGLERNRNGGQALAAILAMPALLGKFRVRGGGYTMSNSGAVRFDPAAVLGECKWDTRVINMTRLGRALSPGFQPPVKGLFVYNSNPAVTAPDQQAVLRGLARDDLFTVVFDQVMTDTARYADILLPATTFLEQREIRRAYGSYVVGGIQPAIQPCGEAKSNVEVFALLAREMGWDAACFGWSELQMLAKAASAIRVNGAPVPVGLLECGESVRVEFNGGGPVQFQSVFPRTPDRKACLTPACLGEAAFKYERVESTRYPLALVSPGHPRLISSTFGEANLPELYVLMHPDDARTRGLQRGAPIRVFNDLGEVICTLRISEKIRPGVVLMPKGAWRKASQNGLGAAALCPDWINSVAGGACFNDARVEVAAGTAGE